MGIRQIDASGTTITYRWLKVENDSDWKQYDLQFTPHPNAETISVYFKMKHATEVENDGPAWVDDVELIEVSVQSSTDIQKQIERFEDSGEFENERVIRTLKIHLTAIERFEKQEEVEKVVKHMKGFVQLLAHQNKNELISDKAYNVLKEDAQLLMGLWKQKTNKIPYGWYVTTIGDLIIGMKFSMYRAIDLFFKLFNQTTHQSQSDKNDTIWTVYLILGKR